MEGPERIAERLRDAVIALGGSAVGGDPGGGPPKVAASRPGSTEPVHAHRQP
jgi:hypothetical protein